MDGLELSPSAFNNAPVYKYGLVYVVGCFAGAQDWDRKGAVGADIYVSPNTPTIGTVPSAKPPKE